ncbi:Holliday junction resolvase RuvX [bacterium]|nr:Holliday junction resolvase RuvX [bacterium]
MRILGLDIGDKRIGVSVSDELGITAQGRENIYRESDDQVINEIYELINNLHIDEVVVGMPKNMNGTLGSQAEKVMKFSKALASSVRIPIKHWDERLTTVIAQRSLTALNVKGRKKKKKVDRIASQLILQGYLDNKSLMDK